MSGDPVACEFHEKPGLRVLKAAVRVEKGELHRKRRRRLGHGHQRPRCQMMHDLEQRFQDNAMPAERPFGQHVAIVGFERTRDVEALGPAWRLQRPAEFRGARKAQVQAIVFVRDECLAIGWVAAPFDIGRRSTENARALCDLANAQGTILWLTQKQREVEPLGRQVDLPVRKAEADVDLGVFGFELWDEGAKEPATRAKWRRHKERAAR